MLKKYFLSILKKFNMLLNILVDIVIHFFSMKNLQNDSII